jgi:hypothetical protein
MHDTAGLTDPWTTWIGFPGLRSRAVDKQHPPQDSQHEVEDPEIIAARVKRRMFMGAALFLALASIYSGLLGAPRLVQVALAAIAAACVFVAFKSGSDAR